MLKFKYIVKGDHPLFQKIFDTEYPVWAYQRIDRKCLSIDEANNIADGLEAVGYKVKIELIKDKE